jgi:hypothetical protein
VRVYENVFIPLPGEGAFDRAGPPRHPNRESPPPPRQDSSPVLPIATPR